VHRPGARARATRHYEEEKTGAAHGHSHDAYHGHSHDEGAHAHDDHHHDDTCDDAGHGHSHDHDAHDDYAHHAHAPAGLKSPTAAASSHGHSHGGPPTMYAAAPDDPADAESENWNLRGALADCACERA